MLNVKNVKIGGVIVLVGLIFMAGRRSNSAGDQARVVIEHPLSNFTDIQLPIEQLTIKAAEPFIAPVDVAEVKALLAENKRLKRIVNQLSTSLAETTSQGSGIAVVSPITPLPSTIPVSVSDIIAYNPFTDISPNMDSPPPPPPPYQLKFSDYRLNFLAKDTEVSYTLSQKFLILNTTGYNERNVATNLIRLFEIGPGDARTPIPISESTTISAGGAPHWYVKFGIQGGVGQVFSMSADGSRVGAPSTFVATPWLKRGRNQGTENTRWAIATPVLAIPLAANRAAQASIGLLPVSFNFGSVMGTRKLITNLWISPYIGTTTGTTMNQVGGLLSVTF